jgi:3-deoxy-7-phosphoheptulonate synthase
MEVLGEGMISDLTRAEFFTSHEALNLWYESAQTRRVPRREGFYNLSTHLPWIGDRTRALDGAHIEYARGIRNPVGVKLGPTATPREVMHLATTLNPGNEPGKLVFITRLGAHDVQRVLPPMLEAARIAGLNILWVCDPMHGNTTTTATGVKTRSFDAIVAELEATDAAHRLANVPLGGVHFELTGDDVTECTGGAVGITESQLSHNYATACDPRLNYQQALEVAFLLARRMGR